MPKKIIRLAISRRPRVEWIDVKHNFDDCRDPKDNFLLNLCVSGKADYLITGDEDLLILNPFQKTVIINYRKFQDILNNL
ncbi:MAG: putative toxin-antitoxin system toxin component, PIN family [Deltaproteobacteria bacterium]|nr:putative toxin-antitoxin system toxin component, PIN family [Deltaproteobacteria bacterium]